MPVFSSRRASAYFRARPRAFSDECWSGGRRWLSGGAAKALPARATARAATTSLFLKDLLLAHGDGLPEPVLLPRLLDVVAVHLCRLALAVLHRELEVLAGGEVGGVRLPDLPFFAGRAAGGAQERRAEEQHTRRGSTHDDDLLTRVGFRSCYRPAGEGSTRGSC